MSSPPSQTRICNAALALLGETARIVTINDGSPIANQFLTHWDQARRAALADHPWNFALARADCPASSDTPAGEQYAIAFEMPADCLRWLPYAADHPDYFCGEQEGGRILSNADAPICVRYIRDVENVGLWSPAFVEAMTAKLAYLTAKPITGQTGAQDRMAEQYDRALRIAKRQDGAATGDRARRLETRSSWLAARNGPVRVR